jgi:hypothetical protein
MIPMIKAEVDKFRNFAKVCRDRAEIHSEASFEWLALAQQWEALAETQALMPAISNFRWFRDEAPISAR